MDGRAERGERGVRPGIKRPSPSAVGLELLALADMQRLDFERARWAGPQGWVERDMREAAARARANPARCPCGARAADHE